MRISVRHGLFRELPRITVVRDLCRVHANIKEVSYLPW